MGIRDDIKRYKEIGEERRMDLEEFIKQGQLGPQIQIPIKTVNLPEFTYDMTDRGGVGQGEGDVGDPLPIDPEEGEEGEGDEAGEGEGEHGYYEMDPEEFARELDEELGLDLEPKGKKVSERVEGDLTDVVRSGPESTVILEELFKKGLKRKIATQLTNEEEQILKELLKVKGMGPQKVFEYARDKRLPVSLAQCEQWYSEIDDRTKYEKVEDVDDVETLGGASRKLTNRDVDKIPIRREDKRHKYPEIIEKREKNVVVVNIRDVSGSMRQNKRELVERIFTPMDWYLQGKYDKAEFVYIAHDSSAWEVDRDEFFGIRSGGGTTISSAYKLAQRILEEKYPWDKWNRYVFAAGDGENSSNDSREEVVPLMKQIDANLHAYLQTNPGRGSSGNHAEIVEEEIGDLDNVSVARVTSKDDIMDAIKTILSTEDSE